jgi:hypothetical protein
MQTRASIIAALTLAGLTQGATAGCLPVIGTVQLTEEATCQVANLYPAGTPFVGAPSCYQVTLKLGGLLPAYGHAGVASEAVQSQLPEGGVAASPAAVQGRGLLTARSTFSLGGTRFYAAEVIVDSNGFITEQSVITGTDGRGLFKNASGGFTVLGNSIGETAQVRGQICTP